MEVKMKKIVTKCPVCDNPLEIVELKCPACGTTIQGNFQFDKIMLLEDDDMQFLMEFLRSRGNIKEVQSRLDISYPTVKAKLDKLLKSLGLYEKEKVTISKEEILERLEKGEIKAEEAIKLLKGGKDDD
jgi:hypothetical protein